MDPIPTPPLRLLRNRGLIRSAAKLTIQWPRLLTEAPGQGRPVRVFPGWLTGDASTWPMRHYLRRLGYDVRGWGRGLNRGAPPALIRDVTEDVVRQAKVAGAPVSLVGWSLGGLIARGVARRAPDAVEQVITLGTPVQGGAKYTMFAPVVSWMYDLDLDDLAARADAMQSVPVPVPLSVLWSKRDSVVAWQAAQDPWTQHAEHIELTCTHTTFGLHPDALRMVAQRLSAAADRSSAQRPQPEATM